ncbi:cell division ATP-binding protein FtsE [Planctomonas sp. JC2975]|uniref:cell division ATP-binding protein FtsE n=1 Tax=Planctomonas sp. JC2975 TaxID=2729626 RepID=UPI001474BD82|nr:cell division ATP-binding protein FtsE [Planctomonas sp. JC2975]NNC11109.1 cell division ATP-binding protein FtsE [Planctomonas sp. JC2975]
MIRFEHVSKSYKGTPRPALDDITTEILRGEFVFVVGASGSGKSTFLRLILREEKVTRGKLHVLGQDLNTISNRKVPYFRRNVGVVFQDFRLLTNKTVFDNVAFTLKVIGKSKGFIHEAVPDVLAMVGLEEKAGRFPHELSGGEQQRVAIARAVVNKPQILLADEPTGNLDPATSAGITAVLERINAAGTTVLMATHEAGLVDQMQKRVIELVDGKLVRDERHGGYGFTAALPVLGSPEETSDIPAGYGLPEKGEVPAHPVAVPAAAVAKPKKRRGGKSSRTSTRPADAIPTANSAAPVPETQPSQTPLPVPARAAAASVPMADDADTANGALTGAIRTDAAPRAAAPVSATPSAAVPTRGGAAADAAATTSKLGHFNGSADAAELHTDTSDTHTDAGEREPVAVAARGAESASAGSVVDVEGHFANPPTAPVRRADSGDVAELTLAERLGLRAPGKHDHDDDSNQDVGPVS